MRVQRWCSLEPEIDDLLVEKAKQEGRSIANMIKNIVTNYLHEEAKEANNQ